MSKIALKRVSELSFFWFNLFIVRSKLIYGRKNWIVKMSIRFFVSDVDLIHILVPNSCGAKEHCGWSVVDSFTTQTPQQDLTNNSCLEMIVDFLGHQVRPIETQMTTSINNETKIAKSRMFSIPWSK